MSDAKKLSERLHYDEGGGYSLRPGGAEALALEISALEARAERMAGALEALTAGIEDCDPSTIMPALRQSVLRARIKRSREALGWDLAPAAEKAQEPIATCRNCGEPEDLSDPPSLTDGLCRDCLIEAAMPAHSGAADGPEGVTEPQKATLYPCPNGCGTTVSTLDRDCPGCRRPLAAVEIAVSPMCQREEGSCWQWWGSPDHRMRCRKPKDHRGPHSTHNDCGRQNGGWTCGEAYGHAPTENCAGDQPAPEQKPADALTAEAQEFAECASCSAKTGSPTLCASCLHNRELASRLRALSADRDRLRAELARAVEEQARLKEDVAREIGLRDSEGSDYSERLVKATEERDAALADAAHWCELLVDVARAVDSLGTPLSGLPALVAEKVAKFAALEALHFGEGPWRQDYVCKPCVEAKSVDDHAKCLRNDDDDCPCDCLVCIREEIQRLALARPAVHLPAQMGELRERLQVSRERLLNLAISGGATPDGLRGEAGYIETILRLVPVQHDEQQGGKPEPERPRCAGCLCAHPRRFGGPVCVCDHREDHPYVAPEATP